MSGRHRSSLPGHTKPLVDRIAGLRAMQSLPLMTSSTAAGRLCQRLSSPFAANRRDAIIW